MTSVSYRASASSETVLNRQEASKKSQEDFVVSRIDQYVFILIPKHKQHFWSPQLHLEVDEIDTLNCLLHRLFEPSPTVWTLFMFLHFIVACLFIGFGVWAYSNAALDNSYTIQIARMFFMVLVCFSLYFGGRCGKATGKQEMIALYEFMKETIN
ncbi:GTP-binding protein [Kordia sp.]|uniref:GTP-binding protein n=1 Tax=Kordia sp. TaxID=1965332 RepID=UPI0025BF160A|nr:GTP-binding protein [Kordia sp.]MCH2195517.1 GTP-binding protein [Kordia sp.]